MKKDKCVNNKPWLCPKYVPTLVSRPVVTIIFNHDKYLKTVIKLCFSNGEIQDQFKIAFENRNSKFFHNFRIFVKQQHVNKFQRTRNKSKNHSKNEIVKSENALFLVKKIISRNRFCFFLLWVL